MCLDSNMQDISCASAGIDVAANLCNSTGNLCTLTGIAANVFQDTLSQDFHLRAGSPAQGTGVPLSSLGLNVDKDGVPHPPTGPVDVGAYQYVPWGPVIPAPQHLRAIVQ